MQRFRPWTVLTLIVAGIAATPMAFSQDEAAPSSRAQINAATRAAEKAGQLRPAGEAADFGKPTRMRSTETRAEVKGETRAAEKAGQLEPAGEAENFGKPTRVHSTKTRAQRKAETLSAAKTHQLVPAGEGPGGPAK